MYPPILLLLSCGLQGRAIFEKGDLPLSLFFFIAGHACLGFHKYLSANYLKGCI
uniref:Uncharacterized protein n=1 Tax=Anguilla anguilla TaxID=7936 RepID=A0A0E9Q860_ANGAN